MSIGPVEYLILGFPGEHLSEDLAPAFAGLVDSGTVRILDILFLSKDGRGHVVVREFDELDSSLGFAAVAGRADGVLSEGDAAIAAQALDPGSSAILVLWEDRWARPLADVVRSAGGIIVGGQRVPPDVVEMAFAGLPPED
ncbi:MAG TPA: DUF6325 family protein [Acidimicrobiales bacterium]|jgi:hypothetical protein|nr:DUF6325 family protein [Acidimicrobiales bacterium]